MESEYFSLGFLSLFFITMTILFFILKSFSPTGLSAESWAIFIILFTLFGIIAISVFIKHIKSKKTEQKEGL